MSAQTKILRTANTPTTSNETGLMVAQAILDLETNVPNLTAELRPLQISAAWEVKIKSGRKAIVIFVHHGAPPTAV
ncbi:30S ribosomal protein S7e [Puccinia triticina 1-1 BBBD Race 1]|uniref:30S ribosomal protein S7e n=1 Tax=Puccinia triticina (isolate 1-1 / race 1 (BBBD)) TaxID=630390 RepID=A0A180H033_PUCT1|nr:30S ribosomal protein S7e [Puccinia triticina 1-1 BBBD Race 1]